MSPGIRGDLAHVLILHRFAVDGSDAGPEQPAASGVTNGQPLAIVGGKIPPRRATLFHSETGGIAGPRGTDGTGGILPVGRTGSQVMCISVRRWDVGYSVTSYVPVDV